MGALWGQGEVRRCLQAMLAEIHSGSLLLFLLALPLFPETWQGCDHLLPAVVTRQSAAILHVPNLSTYVVAILIPERRKPLI